MSRWCPPLTLGIRALLDHERDIPPLPAMGRARAVARARAALVAGIGRRAAPTPPRTRWAAAGGLAVWIASAAVGSAAYQVRAHFAIPPGRHSVPSPVETAAPLRRPVSPARIADAAPAPAHVPAWPVASQADAARAELRLLRQARAAVAREDYAAALPPIAEHIRRFERGRLTEEREALRVKALVGVGRIDEARRGAVAFRERFSRSVLLPVISGCCQEP